MQSLRLPPSQLFAWVVCIVLWTGCGPGAISENSAADAQAAFDAGIAEFAEKKFPQAEASLSLALQTPGLNADLLVTALLTRARARIEQGNFAAAAEDVVAAEQGAADLEQVHVVRGLIYLKQGDAAKAKAEFNQARKLNPRVEIPK